MLAITPGKKLLISILLDKLSIHFYSVNKLRNNFITKNFCNFLDIGNNFPGFANQFANFDRIFHFRLQKFPVPIFNALVFLQVVIIFVLSLPIILHIKFKLIR